MLEPQPTEENPITIEGYPYGWKRTQAQYWIETTKRGQRVVFRTKNPKTQKWNKPKKSTYSDIRILYRNSENGHIENDGLTFAYTDAKRLSEFLNQFPEEKFSAWQKEKLRILRAILKTREYVSVSIVENPTPEEVEEIEQNNANALSELEGIFHSIIIHTKEQEK